jgi:RNA polymerase sigma-70 factor (ECF subfamily)
VTAIRPETATPPQVDVPTDWVSALSTPGPARDSALRALHALLLRAARAQVARMGAVTSLRAAQVDEVINQAADEALLAILGKLSTFEGRSRFTTWAYKFAVLNAAVEVRRRAWEHREVPLDDVLLFSADSSPNDYAEAADFARAVKAAISTALSPHQRRILLALVVDEVPIDVLAERLGTTRNALYKALHDARSRLRADLASKGYLAAQSTRERDK